MKILVWSFLLVIVSASAVEVPVTSSRISATALKTRGELPSLAHACELVRAINEAKWQEAESMITPKLDMLPLIQRDADTSKDWPGIGAYRGTDRTGKILRHRFAYGPGRNHPHELWISYSVTDDRITFESIVVLGW